MTWTADSGKALTVPPASSKYGKTKAERTGS
jgi:hypothetical protein